LKQPVTDIKTILSHQQEQNCMKHVDQRLVICALLRWSDVVSHDRRWCQLAMDFSVWACCFVMCYM